MFSAELRSPAPVRRRERDSGVSELGSASDCFLCRLRCEGERDVDDHVLLTTHQTAASSFEQQCANVDSVALRRSFGVAQEARVHAGVAESEGFAIDADRPVLQRSDDVVGGILQGEQVAAVLPLLDVGDGDEGLEGAVAGTGA